MDAVVSKSREMIRKGSRSFALASRVFDTATRDHAWMLYAWCRHCDDEIDGQELGGARHPGQLRQRLTARQPGWPTSDRDPARPGGQANRQAAFQAFGRVARERHSPGGTRWNCWPRWT
jgi:phytoene synthase